MKTKSRLSFKVLLVILLSFMLLTTVSYAWFYANVNLGGNTIETDSLEYEAYGYDSTGAKVSTILNEGQTSTATNVNSPIFSVASFQSELETIYVSIKSNSSMDLEYNFSISARGHSSTSNDKNITQLGKYWYRITDITSKVSTLSEYINTYGSIAESEDKINMKEINTDIIFGLIGASDANKTRYYRVDFGFKTGSDLSKMRFELFANVEVDQKGNTNTSLGSNQEFKISDSQTLINAIEAAGNNDTLYFTNDVEYFGDLIIRKSLNMNLAGKTLTVIGNIHYNFQTVTTLKLDLSGSGKIKVLAGSGSDGNLIFDAPNAQIEIKGTSPNGGLIVENDIIISCSNEDNKYGCQFSGVKAVKPDGSYATIKLRSYTTVTISSETNIDTIYTEDNATNIRIVNNGNISNILLSNMRSSTQIAIAQIYIQNYLTINNIVLPSWSVAFSRKSDGSNSGNTYISNSFGAEIISLSGSSKFTKSKIKEVSKDLLVERVDGTNTNLRVIYRDKTDGTVTTIEGLLNEFFVSKYPTRTAEEIEALIVAIKRLEIDAVSGKSLNDADLKFINNTKMTKLKTLDLSEANLVDNTLPTGFYNLKYITTLTLPKNLLRIEKNAFGSKVTIQFLTIPSSVLSLGENALANIDYAVFESVVPPKVDVKSYVDGNTTYTKLGTRCNFVPAESVEAYDAAFTSLPANNWTNYALATYPYATLADDGAHFVRPLEDGTYEIVTVDSSGFTSKVTNKDYVIGQNLTVNGEPIVVSTIGRCAYLNFKIETLNVTFADSVHTIRWRSFDNAKFKNIDFCNVQNFEDLCGRGIDILDLMAFSKCERFDCDSAFTEAYIVRINTGALKEIGPSAFSANYYVTEIICPELVIMGENCFYRCENVLKIEAPKAEKIGTTAIRKNYKLYELSLPSVKEVGWGVLYDCPSLTSLHFGPNLYSVSSESVYSGTTSIKTLYIESPAYVKMQFLFNITIDRIYVSSTAYQGYYDALNISSNTKATTNRDHLLDYGAIKVGDYTETIYYSTKPVVEYNYGEYNVALEPNGVTIVSYNPTTISSTYEIPKTLVVNGVEMPVVGIGRNVFKGKAINPSSLNNVEKIGEKAFASCTSLTVLNAPNLKTAGRKAFADCTNLTTANIPQLTHWSDGLFYNCSKLAKIVSECKFTSEASAISGSTKAKLTNITINYEVASSANLPDTTVFDGLKSQCANVVLYVKAKALAIFKANTVFNALTPTAIGDKVTDANNNTYYLTPIVIGSSTYYQVEYVSGNGSDLIVPATYSSKAVVGANIGAYDDVVAEKITLSQNYSYVQDGEFSNVTNLKTFVVNSNNKKLKVVNSALYSYDGLELIAYPNSKTATNSEYTIDSSTKIIRNSAFKNVTSLITVNVNSGISYIGADAFKGSTVTTFVFSSETAPYLLGAHALGSSVTTIKVPSTLLDAYKASFRLYASCVVANQ